MNGSELAGNSFVYYEDKNYKIKSVSSELNMLKLLCSWEYLFHTAS